MSPARTKALNLGEDGIYRIFFHYAVPSVLSMLALTSAQLVDSIFIGRYVGPEGLAGITLFVPVLLLLEAFSTMVAVGGVTLAGIHSGRGESGIANNYFSVTASIVLVFSLLTTGLTWFLADSRFLVRTLNVSLRGAALTTEYARTLTWFYAPLLLNYTLSLFTQLSGRPTIVVVITLAGTVMNIVLDWLLVARLGMGMRGAALATGLAFFVTFVLQVSIILRYTSWTFRRPVFHVKHMAAMLFNGSSELLTMASLSIAGFVYNWVILQRLGELGVAAYGIALIVAEICITVFYGIGEAIQSPVSFNYGAKLKSRFTTLRRLGILSAFLLSVLMFPPLFFWGGSISGLFTDDQTVVSLGARVLKFFALSFLPGGVNIMATLYYTAINKPVISAVLAVLRSLAGLVLGLAIFPGLVQDIGLWIPLIFTELLTFAPVCVLLLRWPVGLDKDVDKAG